MVNDRKRSRGAASAFSSRHVSYQGITDKKLRGRLKERERLYGEAAVTAAKAEQVSCALVESTSYYDYWQSWKVEGGPPVSL